MKGQVTLFVITALVIIIASTMFISSNNKKQLDILKQSEDINLKQVAPVKMYVEMAMQNLLLEGYVLIGKQTGKIFKTTWPDCLEENSSYTQYHRMCNQNGTFEYGYPDFFPKYLEKSPYVFKRISVGINSSRGTPLGRIMTSSFEPLEQPFAYPHVGKTRGKDYIYGFQQPLPPITSTAGEISIEYELARWIENHIVEMINFSEFEERGFDIKIVGVPKVNVEIEESYMTAHLNYTLDIKKAGIDYVVKEYYTQIQSDFRRTYNYINWAIREDVSTKSHIMRQKLYNETGGRIGGIAVHESYPPNFQYDVVNVTIWSIDYRKTYNTVDPGYHFYFIRENRPSDAGTVKDPQGMYLGEMATWYCYNLKTSDSPFDPDEDDEWPQDPFPWTNPPWYNWYSRGDYMKSELPVTNEGCDGKTKVEIPKIDLIRRHTEPFSKDFGATDVVQKLQACGNKDDMVTIAANDLGDVGDLIILRTSDQQDFKPGGGVTAPARYPDPIIIEDGTGRLNDAISYRPVKCTPGYGGSYYYCCSGGYWKFDDKPDGPQIPDITYKDICVSSCSNQHCQPNKNKLGSSCDCDSSVCNNWQRMYYHCDHEGMLQPSDDMVQIPPIGVTCGPGCAGC